MTWRSSHKKNFCDLNKFELAQAMRFAFDLRMRARSEGMVESGDADSNGLWAPYNEVMGAVGHRALVKWCGVEWKPEIDGFHYKADIGKRVEVRYSDNAELILRDNDEGIKHRYFFLVTGRIPRLRIVGFLHGIDVFDKMPREGNYYTTNERRPCWHIKESDIKCMSEYPEKYKTILD